MRQTLVYCYFVLLSSTASAFLPQGRLALRPITKSSSVGWVTLAAEARNASDVSKENVGEYRNSVPSSRTDSGKLTEVREEYRCRRQTMTVDCPRLRTHDNFNASLSYVTESFDGHEVWWQQSR